MAPWADVLYAMDRAWWKEYGAEARLTFDGEMCTPIAGVPDVQRVLFDHGKNSGLGAIALAAAWGAERVILLGYDCRKEAGRAHWHVDHPDEMGNAGAMSKWPRQFAELARRVKSTEIVNCSPGTAIECFERKALVDALTDMHLPAIYVEGMHGLGDNLHQRAIVKALSKDRQVWLETPWPCLYHDMPEIRLVGKGSKLRTQAKNAIREGDRFTAEPVPASAARIQVRYPPDAVRKHGSVLAAMSAQCGVSPGDFRLPVPQDWVSRASILTRQWDPEMPLMIFRPLVERKEWGGCRNRNPDQTAYRKLFEAIRERYFVVSIADLEESQEWLAGPEIGADVALHRGELDIEVLAGLVSLSSLVFSSPGFAVILAQALGIASVAVFGGYEQSASFAAGAAYAPYLGLDPVRPCNCFSHTHSCDKRMDLTKATQRLLEFVDANYPQSAIRENRTA